jgi:hypothetical protein
VKEQVKRVLNYKKPAFWITIAVIIVCVIIAICFLTNPVNSVNDEVRIAETDNAEKMEEGQEESTQEPDTDSEEQNQEPDTDSEEQTQEPDTDSKEQTQESDTDSKEVYEELVRVVSSVGLENAYPWNNTVDLKEDADALIKMASDETGRFEIYGIMSAKYGTYGLLLNDWTGGEENWNFVYVPWMYSGAMSEQPILEPDGNGKYVFAYVYQYDDVPWWRECILDCGYDTGHMELRLQNGESVGLEPEGLEENHGDTHVSS